MFNCRFYRTCLHGAVIGAAAAFGAHPGDILGALKEAGHIVLWLPPYSPDLNPIEKTWAWIKKIRREWRISCVETLLFWFLNLV